MCCLHCSSVYGKGYYYSLPQNDAPIYYSTIGYGSDYSQLLEQVSTLLSSYHSTFMEGISSEQGEGYLC